MLLIISLLISGIGLVILHALSYDLFIHQLYAVVVGVIAFLVIRRIGQVTFQKLWWVWYIIAVVLLVVTLSTPAVRGSHRWIEIFGQTIQPSEVMKPFLIVALAGFLSLRKRYEIGQYFAYTGLFIVPIFLVFQQPDLGNSIVYIFTYLSILFVSRFSPKYYITPILSLIAAIPVFWPFLQDYQKLRIITFINPTYDMQGAGYNAYQSLIAVGSGGWFGKGLGAGTQSNLSFLPEFHTDFIFAATVEQIGLVGGLFILALYGGLLFRILSAHQEGSVFARLTIWAFFSQFLVQILINIGMNIGIVPITGTTLPLISYGGSSIVAIFISLGIISSFRSGKRDVVAIR